MEAIMDFDVSKADNKEYVLEMVSKQGSLLDLASDRLKNDKEVVLASIKKVRLDSMLCK